METGAPDTLLQRKLGFLVRLKKLVERERAVITAGRFDDLALLGRKKGRIMAAVDAVDAQIAALGTRPAPPAALETLLRETAALAADNERLLSGKMGEMLEGLKDTRETRKVQQAYLPQRKGTSVFLDYSK